MKENSDQMEDSSTQASTAL